VWVVVQWSEIRELTHRARRSKMLEGKDKAKSEALKAAKLAAPL
jgi:hypothetical protein